MTRLLGIALVVDDIHKGCNLAFRYPAPRTTQDHGSSFHKLSAALLAKLFRPKNALCNQSFELVIDDLRFISHPVLVPRRAVVGGSNNAYQTQRGASDANSAGPTHETTMFNVIFALDERHEDPDHDQDDAASVDAQDGLASGGDDQEAHRQRRKRIITAYRNVAAQLANGMLHEELRSGFVTQQVLELLHIRDELIQNERLMASSNGNGNGGNAVNGTSGGGNNSINSSSGSKDNGGSGGGTDSTNASVQVDPQTLIDVSLGKSVLANDLKGVFHGLEESGTAHVVINSWVKLSLTLTDTVSLKLQNLRPYHTLLLLSEEDKILSALPADHSYQLRVLIAAANPLKSFQDLSLETGMPLHQLFRLAAHLVYWGYGRVIDTITMHNIYQVHPNCSLRVQSACALEFRRKFPPHELCEILSSYAGSRRIGEYVKSLSSIKKIEYIHMLIWLLQHDFVIQLHRYVYFMVPSDHDPLSDSFISQQANENALALANRRRLSSSAAPLLGISGNGDALLAKSIQPSNTSTVGFSDQERAYLDKIATTNPVFTLFKRLCVYFHGQYHLEEIMWRENVSRSELRTVLSTYQDIIVCCLHE
ncbi:hypothetical protein Poli38472_014097 [Pythium oligandrum]|uniref:GATOR1 complex protein NPRL3 C-terminal HTH domain-containing protein n=1 Tax=Pythium oligandrum TaxID=41045 RepID=A0A8K1CQC2_PYTOL|nr:hypothetical protein Poli38472_014097 [Pythium oligandrum]|eukprot:TMW66785.1 hypothetical protein Poli38472_014097 [Pythium oligandrum]